MHSVVVGPHRFEPESRCLRTPSRVVELTALEARFLAYLIERRGTVVPVATLLREVWEFHPDVQSKAVNLVASRLRRKIGEPPLFQAAKGGGYSVSESASAAALAEELVGLVDRLEERQDALQRLGEAEDAARAALAGADGVVAARLTVAIVAWSVHRQIQVQVRPLWELLPALPASEAPRVVLWAGRASIMGGGAMPAEVVAWADTWPDEPAGRAAVVELNLVVARQSNLRGDHAEALRRVDRATELADVLGEPRLRSAALSVRANIELVGPGGDRDLALALHRDALVIVERAGHLPATAVARFGYAGCLFGHGHAAAAAEAFSEAARAMAACDRPHDATLASLNAGLARLALGDVAAAKALILPAVAWFAEVADHPAEAHARFCEGRVFAWEGAFGAAAVAFRRARLLAERQKRPRLVAMADRYLGVCAQGLGDRAAARACYDAVHGLDPISMGYVAVWRAWLEGTDASAAWHSLREQLGVEPDGPVAAPQAVDARLTRLLCARGVAPGEAAPWGV